MKRNFFYLFGVLLIFMISTSLQAQISAPGSDGSDKTSYPSFPETDIIFIFCTNSDVDEIGRLQMNTDLTATKTFLWEKYNNITADFEFYFSESTDAQSSEISGLADGGYRITITQGGTTVISRAWVFNNWTVVDGSVTESDCDLFKLTGEFTTAELKYYDLSDNTELQVYKDVKVQWKDGDNIISTVLSTTVYDPPTKDTEYTLRVYDKFECDGTRKVTYV